MTHPTRPFQGQSAESRVQARRQQLLSQAYEIIASEGWRKLSIHKLCAQAGLNKRYFYESFDSLDAMARISGVGAKKLERYGADFLSVITGAGEEMHPTRRKLAGRDAGAVYDRLMQVQADLARGACGTEKPLSCSASLLAKVAERRPSLPEELERLLGERRSERFGAAFLDVLREAS